MAVPLKPTIDAYRSTISINITEPMIELFANKKNRSAQILRLMDEYLEQLNVDLEQTHEHHIITISKPWSNLNAKIYKAVKNGIAFSRSELFRQAIVWQMSKIGKKVVAQLEIDQENGVIRNDDGEIVYNIIGTA